MLDYFFPNENMMYNLRDKDCYEISRDAYLINTTSKDDDEDLSTVGHCYLLQLLPEVLSDTPIYKIGRASDLLHRLRAREYQNARIICTREVSDMYACEREIISVFSEIYERITHSKNTSYGAEYFKGDEYDMIAMFNFICDRF